jgi:hypothetical protein
MLCRSRVRIELMERLGQLLQAGWRVVVAEHLLNDLD